MIFFSIVIPVYNRESLISESIRSVLSQDYNSFELIVINDGSTDGTSGILAELAKTDSRIKLYEQENKERGAARNKGLKCASGDYVIFFDSDDFMHTNHLKVLSEEIPRRNFPDFIATKFNIRQGSKYLPSDILKLNEGIYDYRLFLNGNPLACSIVTRNILLPAGNCSLIIRMYGRAAAWISPSFRLHVVKTRMFFLFFNV